MNNFFNRIIVVSLIFLIACKKEKYGTNNMATLTVFNGIVQKNVELKINGSISNSGANSSNNKQYRVPFGSSAFFYAEARNASVGILDEIDSSSLVSQNFDLSNGSIYTMLLAGTAPNAEAVLIDDSKLPKVNLSVTPSEIDSIANIRFINLVPDIPGIDVRITGSTNNEVTSLTYKSASDWKGYPAKVANGTSIQFQFVENGIVRGTGTVFFAVNRFKNVALVLTGMKTPASGQPSLSVKTMNYYQ